MTVFIPVSERFSSRPVDPEELRGSLPAGLKPTPFGPKNG
jgi:hypothetical protein